MADAVRRDAPVSLTLSEFLFARDPGAVGDVTRRLVDSNLLTKAIPLPAPLTSAAHRLLGDRVVSAVAHVAAIDVGALALGVWAKHRTLRGAAQATIERPSSPAVVDLAEHTIRSKHEPTIEILVHEQRAAVLPLEIDSALLVRSVVATVDRGRLVELATAGLRLRASISCHGYTVVRRTDELRRPIAFSLGSGITLIDEPGADAA